ncbi:type II toxin-antitoxin system VapC family toxin [Rhizobium sp. CSW-27]|uniref:type II toxin-antitoxin system VapC family toxin n=1 Tax=Rhizobium sp. CSW-27 TaxID=2839985 RepID=UPI001C02EF80|nr:type II toxin-antitoxin system VapC family toxin [Rhizobium sp. CSW-27]MBT9369239.1 type II toxin-antitoxin system VapC family toxin [Rhizobium sp. CSW-27]
MFVVDTSALIAIIKQEPLGDRCAAILTAAPCAIISAGTLVEARIVAHSSGRIEDLDRIVAASISEIVPVTEERSRLISAVYSCWGKGIHPASLNFGDCFAYATAREFGCPLLYIGDDFAKTAIVSALAFAQP